MVMRVFPDAAKFPSPIAANMPVSLFFTTATISF
jgi:hypothetical protein